jgi:uncharacterized protein
MKGVLSNDLQATKAMAFFFSKGELVQQNYQTALALFQKVALYGDPEAQYQAGIISEIGPGNVHSNLEEAFSWLEKASEQNHAMAKLHLSSFYLNAKVVTHNFDIFVKLCEEAATLGDADVKYQVGEYYTMVYENLHIPDVLPKAFDWFEMASEEGHAGADYYLGKFYHNGFGVAQDLGMAVKYYNLAAAGGYDVADLIESARSELSHTYTEEASDSPDIEVSGQDFAVPHDEL